MVKTFKRGYIEKGWNNDYVAVITKVTQSDEYGKFEDIDEDEINRFGGYETENQALEDLKNFFKVKEILDSDYHTIWRK